MEDKIERIRTILMLLRDRMHGPLQKINKESIFVSSFEPVGRWLRLPCSSSTFFFMLKQRDDSERNLVTARKNHKKCSFFFNQSKFQRGSSVEYLEKIKKKRGF